MAATHTKPGHRPEKQCLDIPMLEVDSRVLDLATLVALAQGEVGEIITHGPQVLKGCWNNPEADTASFVQLDGKRLFRMSRNRHANAGKLLRIGDSKVAIAKWTCVSLLTFTSVNRS